MPLCRVARARAAPAVVARANSTRRPPLPCRCRLEGRDYTPARPLPSVVAVSFVPEVPTIRAAIYTRISPQEAAEQAEKLSLAVQEQACRALAVRHGATVVDLYQDAGYTSRSLDRPALQRLLSRLDLYDRIYVLDQSRWTRGTPADLEHLRDLLQSNAIQLHFINQGEFDPQNPDDVMMSRILHAVDRRTIDTDNLKMRASLDYRARQGYHHGPPPLGYRRPRDKRRPLEIVPGEAELVRRIYDLALRGWTLSAIARQLNSEDAPSKRGGTWRSSTVDKLLRNPVYRGAIRWNDEVLEGAHEPVIDDATWYAVQDIIAGRSFEAPQRRGRLSALFRCGLCGGPVEMIPGAVRCHNYKTEGHHAPLNKSIRAVMSCVWSYVQELLTSEILSSALARHEDVEPEDLAGAIAEIEERIGWEMEVAERGGMPASWVVGRTGPLVERRRELLARAAATSAEAPRPADLSWLREHGVAAVEWLRGRPEVEQRHLLSLLFSRVELHLEGVVFHHVVDLEPRGMLYPVWDASAGCWTVPSLSPWSP